MLKTLCVPLTISLVLNSNGVFSSNLNSTQKNLTKLHLSQNYLNENKSIVKVTTKKIENNINGFTCNLNIPVISGLKNSKIQNSINSNIEKHIIDFAQNLKQEGLSFLKECKDLKIEPRNYFAGTEYTVYKNSDHILSMHICYSNYTGGAHGSHFEKTYNLDLKTGINITLKDIFKNNPNYKNIINKEISFQIKKHNSRKDAFPINGFTTILDNQCFVIEKDSITIIFQPGDIAPYAMGTLKFSIPLQKYNSSIENRFFTNH